MILRATLITAMACAGAVLIWTFAAPPVRAAECEITGKASYYCCEHNGRRTASGSVFNERDMTAAMPSRKYLGRVYKVTSGGKSVTVTITDYGPAKRLNRAIDLSKAAFAKLANPNRGVIAVCLTRVR
jgi:rare lipoprotein A